MASRCHACLAERAAFVHLTLNALYRSAANATLGSDLQHALAGTQLGPDSFFQS